MHDNIKSFVIKLLEKKSSIPKNQSVGDYNYLDSGHIDSIALIKFIAEIEEEFEIELSDDEIMSDEFRMVDGLVNIINSKLRVCS